MNATEQKQRIVHCVYSGLGGHAAVLFTLLDSPGSERFDHFVLFFGIEDLCDEYARTCDRMGIPFRFIRKRGRIALGSHLAVLRCMAEVKPHVIMVNGTSLAVPLLAANTVTRRGWKIVVRETQANHLKTRDEWLGSRAAARSASAVVYLSPEYRAEVDSHLRNPKRRGQARVIPNGVDTDAFDGDRAQMESPARIAMVSRLIPIKDHSTLIEAARLLIVERKCAVRLFIAGEGPTRVDLESQAESTGIGDAVTFLGLLSRPQVVSLLKSVDIYAHCTFGETMSNSILQAMAAGLPIVASDVRGVANMLQDGRDGLLVPVRDAIALADSIEMLVRAPEAGRALGQTARARVVASLSQRRMAEQYFTLFEQLGASTASHPILLTSDDHGTDA